MALKRKLRGIVLPLPRLFGACLAVLATLAALAAWACGGGGGSSSPTTPANTVMVQVMDDFFSPKELSINAGDTVTWVMAGNAPLHTVVASDKSFDSGTALTTKGATFSHTFNTSGVTMLYYCRVHQACCMMQGSVKVGNGPPPNPGY